MRRSSSVPLTVFLLIAAVGAWAAWPTYSRGDFALGAWIAAASFAIAALLSAAIRIANQWERAIVLRLGRFSALRGPGLFLIVPVVDSVPYWIDLRVMTTTFKAERTLTKDTVPV